MVEKLVDNACQLMLVQVAGVSWLVVGWLIVG